MYFQYLCRRVVPVILEDGSENLGPLDAALNDKNVRSHHEILKYSFGGDLYQN